MYPWLRPKFNDKEEVQGLTDGKYVATELAGSGNSADVWFCIPVSGVPSLEPSSRLQAQLCAVKIPSKVNRAIAAREIPILKRITAGAGPHAPRFTLFLDAAYTPNLSECRWLATTAAVGCTLLQLVQAIKPNPIPEELVLHIYLQLGEAVRSLHEMKPPMAHKDLQEINIMMDVSKQEVPGFPNVVLIDFGGARVNPGTRELTDDRLRFYMLLRRLATCNRPCVPSNHLGSVVENCKCSPFWVDFVKTLSQQRSAYNPSDAMSHAEFKSCFGENAVLTRDNVSTETREKIESWMGKAMERVKGVTEEEIRDALKEARLL